METILSEINENLKTIISLLKNNNETKPKTKKKKTEKSNKKVKTEKKKTEKPNKKVKTEKKKTEKLKSNKKTYLTKYLNGILLHGNTFDHRSFIKSLGGFWNKVYKGWIVSESCFDEIIREITELAYENKTLDKNLTDENGDPYTLKYFKKLKKLIDEENLLDSDSDSDSE